MDNLLQVYKQVVMSLFTSCNEFVHKLFLVCCSKFGTSCQQLVTSKMALSDLLQGWSDKSDTVMIKQDCHKVDNTRL